MAEQSKGQVPKQRLVRVFISSTFRDMHAERDRLVKFTFPELRRRCRERGVEFVEVDLRWGVTEEQAERGEVLPICLAEIDRCRPYFIGLLGERYGFIPRQIDPELIKTQPWLEQHRERSLTELEILHGVLNNPEMAGRAFFYFRDTAYLERIPADKRSDFLPEGDASREKLAALKHRIRESAVALRENYPTPEALGDLVLEGLWQAIDQAFPEDDVPDPLDREGEEHFAFAQTRAKVYVGRDEYFARLDEHVAGDGPSLVILGESGSGKSALLSNWALRFQQDYPDDFLVIHFIGSTPQSADYTAILRRVMGEIKRRYDISHDIPTDPQKLREAFPNWLSMAAARGWLILILDALNQLEEKDNAPDLIWLPEYIPPNVRLIISTLPGRSLEALQKRNWPTYTVAPLSSDERQAVIRDYLAQYRKALNPSRTKRITDAAQTANPLYLRALLQELRLFGEHEQLDARMEHYLGADTVQALYQKILQRLEADYEANAPGLTGKALSLIWAARRGLTDGELLELLQVPQAFWAPLYLALEEALVSRSGLLGFLHDYLREAVKDRYLSESEAQWALHRRLADYFASRELDGRKIDELPWHLVQTASWQALSSLLTDPPFFYFAWKVNLFDVRTYWAQIEHSSSLRMTEVYQAILGSPEQYNHKFLSSLASLFDLTGHVVEALPIHDHLVNYLRQSDTYSLSKSLQNKAGCLERLGRLDEATALYSESEQLDRSSGQIISLSTNLNSQAVILVQMGKLNEAMTVLRESERLCGKLSAQEENLANSLSGQARVLVILERFADAIAMLKRSEQIWRSRGHRTNLAATLGDMANVMIEWGKPDEALILLDEVRQIFSEVGDKYHLAATFGNQGEAIRRLGDRQRFAEALALFKAAEELFREVESKNGLQAALGNQALIIEEASMHDEAMALLKEQERICREIGNVHGIALSLASQANLLGRRMRQFDAAKPLADQALQLATDHGFNDLTRWIGTIVSFIQSHGRSPSGWY